MELLLPGKTVVRKWKANSLILRNRDSEILLLLGRDRREHKKSDHQIPVLCDI